MSQEDFNQKLEWTIQSLVRGDFTLSARIAREILEGTPNAVVYELFNLALTDRLVHESSSSLMNMSPLDRFIAQHFIYFHDGHFNETYKAWRMKRVRKLMEVYGIEFDGKRILELGAGIGDIGSIFAELGAEVLGLEGRKVNCNLANLRFRNLDNYSIIQYNLEEDFSQFGRFDLIINFALVEVIERFEPLLECCMKISNTIFLETMVCDSTDPYKVLYEDMPASQYGDWPLSGKSPRPSPACIERLFTDKGFAVHQHFDKDLNSYPHVYNWSHQNNDSTVRTLRRFWSFTKD